MHLNHANLQLQVEAARLVNPVDPGLSAASPAMPATPTPVDPHEERIKQEAPTYPDISSYRGLYKLMNQHTH
jgi:hypothetical protein